MSRFGGQALTRRRVLKLAAAASVSLGWPSAASAARILPVAAPIVASAAWQRRIDVNPLLVPGYTLTENNQVAFALSDPCVLYDDELRLWRMWYAVAWFDLGMARTGIGYAQSTDGITWQRASTMALMPPTDPGAWDYTNVETPTVIRNPQAPADRRWVLWYAGGNTTQRRISGTYPFYAIGVAYSSDGRVFRRLPAAESPYRQAGLALRAQDCFRSQSVVVDGAVADPCVVLRNGTYHLWFTGIGTDTSSTIIIGGIGYAKSTDGIRWSVSTNTPNASLNTRPGGFPAQPSVVWNDQLARWEMWLTNDTPAERATLVNDMTLGYWFAWSRDGEQWTTTYDQGRDFTWDPSVASESTGLATGVHAMRRSGELRLYYGAYGTKNVPSLWSQINLTSVWGIAMASRPG